MENRENAMFLRRQVDSQRRLKLFALFIATGIDHRGKGLTVKEASELPISNLKNGNEKKTKKYAKKRRFLLTR